jgi:hypothetical protein
MSPRREPYFNQQLIQPRLQMTELEAYERLKPSGAITLFAMGRFATGPIPANDGTPKDSATRATNNWKCFMVATARIKKGDNSEMSVDEIEACECSPQYQACQYLLSFICRNPSTVRRFSDINAAPSDSCSTGVRTPGTSVKTIMTSTRWRR